MISTVNTDGHVVFIYLVRPDYYIIKLNSSNIINEQKQYNKLNKNKKLRKRLKWNWRRRSRFERSVCSNQQLIKLRILSILTLRELSRIYLG